MTDTPFRYQPNNSPPRRYANGTNEVAFTMNFNPRPIEWASVEGTPCSAELAVMVALEADRQGVKVNVDFSNPFLPPTAKEDNE